MENIPQKEDSSLAVSIEGSRRRVARRLLDLDRTSMGFQATFLTYLTRFRTIAACWDYLKRKRNPGVSLRNFVGSEKVYLLVNDPEKEASLAPINRLMIERLCTLIRASDPGMSQNNPGFPRHWVVIDEAVSLGKLPGIPKLFDDGRGRGAAGMLGFQNVHDMYDVYGENATNKLIDLCGNKAILRADAKSADEAAAIFGELEVIVTDSDGRSTFARKKVVEPSELRALPQYAEGQLRGFFKVPGAGLWNHEFLHSF